MQIFYNFISLVAIGNFNPAIVNSHFLNRICRLGLGRGRELAPKDLPFLTDLEFKNLKLTVDLIRLNLRESGIKDIFVSKVIEIFGTFYKKLPYTPLTTVGVTINCEIVTERGVGSHNLIEKIQDTSAHLNFFDVNEIQIIQRLVHRKRSGKIWKGSDFRVSNVHNLNRLITIKESSNDSFNINYNYETGNLKEDPSKLGLLLNSYDEFCKEFLGFVKYLEG